MNSKEIFVFVLLLHFEVVVILASYQFIEFIYEIDLAIWIH